MISRRVGFVQAEPENKFAAACDSSRSSVDWCSRRRRRLRCERFLHGARARTMGFPQVWAYPSRISTKGSERPPNPLEGPRTLNFGIKPAHRGGRTRRRGQIRVEVDARVRRSDAVGAR